MSSNATATAVDLTLKRFTRVWSTSTGSAADIAQRGQLLDTIADSVVNNIPAGEPIREELINKIEGMRNMYVIAATPVAPVAVAPAPAPVAVVPVAAKATAPATNYQAQAPKPAVGKAPMRAPIAKAPAPAPAPAPVADPAADAADFEILAVLSLTVDEGKVTFEAVAQGIPARCRDALRDPVRNYIKACNDLMAAFNAQALKITGGDEPVAAVANAAAARPNAAVARQDSDDDEDEEDVYEDM